jgi:hypothetical protein
LFIGIVVWRQVPSSNTTTLQGYSKNIGNESSCYSRLGNIDLDRSLSNSQADQIKPLKKNKNKKI